MNINYKDLAQINSNVSNLSPGDTVKVSYRVKEANRERIQVLPGLVVKVRKGIDGGSFTIRRVSNAVGVEHTFPFASPMLEKVEVVRHGKVRRAKLYYIRRLSAKEARLKERRDKIVEEAELAKVEAISEADEVEEPVTESNVAANAASEEKS